MNPNGFCLHCGNPIEPGVQFCSKCGTKITTVSLQSPAAKKPIPTIQPGNPKSGKTTLLLCIFLGMIGAHRFYVGKKWTGMLMLLSGGAIGVWILIDLLFITTNKFEDKQGNQLVLTHNASPEKKILLICGSVMTWFAVFIACIAAILMYTTNVLVTVVDNQLSALQKGQIEKAYSYTSTEFKKNISIEGFRKYVTQFPALINNMHSNFSERKIVNDTGYLAGILTGKDGTKTSRCLSVNSGKRAMENCKYKNIYFSSWG